MPIYDFNGTTNQEISKLFDWDGTTANRISKVYDFNGTNNNLILANDGVYMKDGVSYIGTPTISTWDSEGTAGTASVSTGLNNSGWYVLVEGLLHPYTVIKFPLAIDIAGISKIAVNYFISWPGQTWGITAALRNTSGTFLKQGYNGGTSAYVATGGTVNITDVSSITTSPVYLQINLSNAIHSGNQRTIVWYFTSILGSE